MSKKMHGVHCITDDTWASGEDGWQKKACYPFSYKEAHKRLRVLKKYANPALSFEVRGAFDEIREALK
jgi:hypothetical protein